MKEMLKGGSFWAGVLTGAVTQISDTVAFMKGKMKKKDYAVQTAENISSAFGVMAGIEYGAILGSAVLPGVGTAVGSVIGGLLGDRAGRYIGQKTGNMVCNQQILKIKADKVSVTNNVMECAEAE
jgi:phage tail tape-measure protein